MRHDRPADWLEVAAARDIVLRGVAALPQEVRPLAGCEGLALAENVEAALDLPPWDNSAMDGFALRAADVLGATPSEPRTLEVVEDIPAGAAPRRRIRAGEAARIMTGAPVPAGADSVVRVEHTDGGEWLAERGGRVRIFSDGDAGRNVRQRGEDVRAGEVVLRAGITLSPAAIGVAASLGRAELQVTRRPVVAVLSSGDELVGVERFEEVGAGRRIVSSNSYSIAAAAREAGAEVVELGIARDDPESIRQRLAAMTGCDALVTTAGMSVGEFDHMLAVLGELQTTVEFWRVRMRPGSPVAFGRIGAHGGIPWFGLPGNPVSALVTFEIFVRPALLRMAGHGRVFPPVVEATVRTRFAGGAGLTRFLRVRLTRAADGGYDAETTGPQGSGVLTSMLEADALLVVPPELDAISEGAVLPAVLIGGRPLQARPGF
jgi:molybdopterin molybdotransferase